MSFLMYLAVMIVSMVVMELLRPKPQGPARPGLEEFTFPTADASRKVPVVWGKPVVSGPNLTWYGDYRTRAIKKKTSGGLFGGGKSQTVGYKYYIGMHMAFTISNGDTRLLKIVVGEDTIWEGNLASGRGYINHPTIWGGDEGEGGIEGYFDWCPGGQGQQQNDYLQAKLSGYNIRSGFASGGGFGKTTHAMAAAIAAMVGSGQLNGRLVPAYRSTARLVWRGGYVGNSKYIKEWKVQVQRLPALLSSGFHDIDGEANPAEILYELIVHKLHGIGGSVLDVNLSTFIEAAQTLHSEKLGLSLIWDGAKPLEEIRKDILDHIDGAMYVNVLTGKWELKLHRSPKQVELDNLMVIDQDMAELDTYARPTRDEVSNEIVVVWTEEGENTKWPARAQDLGLYQAQDSQFISTTVNYIGVTSYDLAAKLATRDLGQLGYPLVKITLRCNRAPYKLTPMSRFKLTWEPHGISEMICVVLSIDYGTLDDNQITIEAIQDVYSLGETLYDNGGSTGGWEPPSRTPVPPTAYRMEFAPYWMMQMVGDIPLPDTAVTMLMVEQPQGTAMGYEVQYTDPALNGVFADAEYMMNFTPTATLKYDYLESGSQDTSATFIVTDLNGLEGLEGSTDGDIQQLAQSLLVVDDEWMAITHAALRDDGTYALTVRRGLGDSTVTRHLAGAKVWFVSDGIGQLPTQLTPFRQGQYRARISTVAAGGVLPLETSPLVTISSNSQTHNVRPLWPYPVRDLTLNGSRTPIVVPNDNLVVTWKPRNRAEETRLVYQDDPQQFAMEVGVRHKAYLYDSTNRLLAESGELTANSFTFLVAGLAGGLPTAGYVQVEAVLAGRGSGQRATIWFGLNVNYQGTVDQAPQKMLAEAGADGAWTYWRMAD